MNSSRLTDLDELSLTVRDRESSLYISEAINAYRGGAYRASIISSWIAVVTDIISKMRELASQGDANAKAQITSIDSAIQNKNVQQLQKIENDLLNKARSDFEFLSEQEFTDLERLKQDRNLCAHPAFVSEGLLFQPQPEMVRAHIVHAILHLLRHKPIQGKSALNKVIADIARSSFPTEQESVNRFLGEKYLNRAKDSFIKNLVIFLIKSYLTGETENLANKGQALIHSLNAVSYYQSSIYEGTLREKLIHIVEALDDEELPKIFKLIGADSRYWTLLDDPCRIRIKTLLKTLDLKDLVEFEVFDAMQIPEFNELLTEKFARLELIEKEQIIATNPRLEFADLAVDLYVSAGSYRSAESLGKNILLPMSQHFTGEHINKILESIVENQQITFAAGTPIILLQFLEKSKHLLSDTKEGWINFVNNINNDPENYYSYPKLREKLVEFGVLDTAYPENN